MHISASLSKVELELGYTHLFMHYLWLLLCNNQPLGHPYSLKMRGMLLHLQLLCLYCFSSNYEHYSLLSFFRSLFKCHFITEPSWPPYINLKLFFHHHHQPPPAPRHSPSPFLDFSPLHLFTISHLLNVYLYILSLFCLMMGRECCLLLTLGLAHRMCSINVE